jgi:cysteine synthase
MKPLVVLPRSATATVLITAVTSLTAIIYLAVVAATRRVGRNSRRDADNKSSGCSAYEQLIGTTPMVRLNFLSQQIGRSIYVKMESMNPGGTGKDRAALCMIQQAEALGRLPAATSGAVASFSSIAATATLGAEKSNGNTISNELHYNPTGVSSSTDDQQKTGHGSTATTTTATTDTGVPSSLQSSISTAMRHSKSGGLVIEGTSGSTGISLATLCAARGHACLVVLPDDQAPEKKRILEVLGATVRVVPTASISNPNHYVNVAKTLASMAREQGIAAVFIDQFENLANFRVHYESTGPEIYERCPQLHAFCMSSGTGGTIAGVAHYLKERKPSVRIVLVDPPGSALYHAVQHGIAYAPQQQERALKRHRYDTIAEGIGLDRLTQNFEEGIEYMDDAIQVSDQEAVDMAHYLLQTEGLWVGSSSAMNVVGAIRTALSLPSGSTVVTVICDAGQRHVARFWNRTFITEWGLAWPGDNEGGLIPECLKNVT